MAPFSDGTKNERTIGASLEKVLPDATHLHSVRDAVHRTHKATLLATELINLHLRRSLRDQLPLEHFFDGNWIQKAYQEVSFGKEATIDKELNKTKEMYMPAFEPVGREFLTQVWAYEAKNLATVARNNVWMHLGKRLYNHVRRSFPLSEDQYSSLTKEEKTERKRVLLQLVSDLRSGTATKYNSPSQYHDWLTTEVSRLGLCQESPKAKPWLCLKAMWIMCTEAERSDEHCFSLYPLRRSFVPRHCRFDEKTLRSLCKVQDFSANDAKRQKNGTVKYKIMSKLTRQELYSELFDLRSVKTSKKWTFDYSSFTTDGTCVRLPYTVLHKSSLDQKLTNPPKRGIWSMDAIKSVTRQGLDYWHVISIDPGKRELVCGVDMDDVRGSPIRYTLSERQKDLRSRQYADEVKRSKPAEVFFAEQDLSKCNSRSPSLEGFLLYCTQRRKGFDDCLKFYSKQEHRHRRWKTVIKTQKSESKLYKKIEEHKNDNRPLLLAYGSWGSIAGRAGAACNKKLPPCIGVGLMRKLSKHFVVVPTPEAYTSKTCCRCFGPCGRWTEKEEDMVKERKRLGHKERKRKEIRGLRRCQNEECKFLPLNRDKNAATNIGYNFQRLFVGQEPIRKLSSEEKKLHKLQVQCFGCDEE